MLQIFFQPIIVKIHAKKIQTLSIKLSTEVTTYILVKKKQKSFCEIGQNIKIITGELIVNIQMKFF